MITCSARLGNAAHIQDHRWQHFWHLARNWNVEQNIYIKLKHFPLNISIAENAQSLIHAKEATEIVAHS